MMLQWGEPEHRPESPSPTHHPPSTSPSTSVLSQAAELQLPSSIREWWSRLLKRRVTLDGNDESTNAVNESAVHGIEIKKLLFLGRK
jgi:hypothetical protein